MEEAAAYGKEPHGTDAGLSLRARAPREAVTKLHERYCPEALLMEKDVEEMAELWLQAKAAEDKTKQWRVAVEEALDALLGHKPEGSKTHTAGPFKITLTGKLYRKMDWEAWEGIKAQVPDELRPTRLVEELDEQGVKWLSEHRPELYAVVAQAITTTPGKVGVKVVRKEVS